MSTYFLVITGPTGTGKSAVALDLARHLPIEIVNGDMGQLYTPLNVGTAKPTPLERMLVPHHLFDVLDEPANFTVAQYRERVKRVMREIWERKNVPVIVGGSGFYIKALFFPARDVAATLLNQPDGERPAHAEWAELNTIDPVRAAQIHPNDRYRIERALALWYETGELPSSRTPIYDPLSDNYQLILLTRDRAELYARIEQRVHDMMPSWAEEVRGLQNTPWEEFLCRKKIIGYCELLKAPAVNSTVIAAIQRDTRRYAKRQLTFFRSLLEQLPADHIHTINMTNQSIDEVASKINMLYSRAQH